MHLRHAALAALITAAAVTAVATPAARAGTYVVEACRDRNFGPGLAVRDAGGGWAWSIQTDSGFVNNVCDAINGGANLQMHLARRLNIPHGNGASWTFAAPANTSISGYDVWWKGYLAPGAQAVESSGSPVYDGHSFGDGNDASSPLNRVSRSGLTQPSLGFHLICSAQPFCAGDGSETALGSVSIFRSKVSLSDDADPQADASGPAVTKSTWTGSVPMRVSATDAGGGVYRLLLKVDNGGWQPVLIDDGSITCRPLYDDTAFAFQHPRPCPLSVSSDVPIDTTGMAEGTHHVVGVIQDAAGNSNTVFDEQRVIDNLPPVVGDIALSGTARDGDELGCAAPINGQSATVAYQWLRAAVDGSGATSISGATAATYKMREPDVGKKLICRVTAEDAGGTTIRSSSITQAPFADGATVVGYCTGRPTGTEDPCGDRDADGILNYKDPTPDPEPSGSDPGPPVVQPVPNPQSPGGPSTRETDRTLIIERGAANGDNASDDARLTAFFDPSNRSRATISFGEHAVIAGKLTDGRGAAITSARVEVVAQAAHAGAAWTDQPSVATRSDGTFTLVVPKGVSSRTLTLRYRTRVRDEKPAAVASVDLRVRAGVGLTITPKKTRNRGTIRFRGALLGKPVPVRGKLVELQARARGTKKWITFRTIRAAKSGRFTARYTFRATYGTITYEFRARAREESSYPFLTGASRVVRVRVR